TIALLPPGKSVSIGVLRDGKRTDVRVAIAARDDDGRVIDASGRRAEAQIGPLGIAVGEVTPQIARSLGLRRPAGVLVTGLDRNGPAARAGVREGDLILEVNRRPVNDVRSWHERVRSVSRGEMVLLRLQRGDSAVYVAVRNDR